MTVESAAEIKGEKFLTTDEHGWTRIKRREGLHLGREIPAMMKSLCHPCLSVCLRGSTRISG